MFDGSVTFEVGLNVISTTDLSDTFTETLCVGYDNVTLVFNFIGGRLGTCGAPISSLSGRPKESFLHLVQSPFGIFTFSESLPEMVLSCWSNSGLLHTVKALWERVWVTLNLAER